GKDGDRVRVQQGSADVRVPKGQLALRQGSELRIGPSPEVLAGDLLVVPSGSLAVQSAGSEAVVRGAARVTRDFAVTVASYAGEADVRSAGSSLKVPALRQATVAALGELPRAAAPLQYRNDDQWDRRFLADAIDLGVELQSRSDGASAQFRNQGRTAGFYRLLFPQLEGQPFSEALLDPARPPGEHVVGAAVSLAGKDGDFAARWQKVFAFRGQGATWGLVAMDQAVARVPNLVAGIDEALGRARLPGQGVPVAAAAPTTTTTTTPPPTRTTTTTSTTRTTPPPTTPTTQPPLLPNPPDTGLPIDPLADDAVDLLNGLLPGG
ncbi:MAG TPA: hypothetical protein VGO92_10000, partial [Acidimicrobiales bacterium]|nr:hypothetical protein [Acidimicrobiales bacterium]